MRHRPSFNLHPSSLLLPLPWGYSRRVISLVYLRVTAEGCGDNGHTLNDTFEAPQVDPLHPGAWDYAVAQRRQHYLEHRQQKQQWDRGEPTAGARGNGQIERRTEGRHERREVEYWAERNIRSERRERRKEDTSLLEGVEGLIWVGPGSEARHIPHKVSRYTAHSGTTSDVTQTNCKHRWVVCESSASGQKNITRECECIV